MGVFLSILLFITISVAVDFLFEKVFKVDACSKEYALGYVSLFISIFLFAFAMGAILPEGGS